MIKESLYQKVEPELVHSEQDPEQRISIIDSSIMKAQDNSDEMCSTQQTSEEQQQQSIMAVDFKLKNRTIQNSLQRPQSSEIDFSVYQSYDKTQE